jgi:hypothetical protein
MVQNEIFQEEINLLVDSLLFYKHRYTLASLILAGGLIGPRIHSADLFPRNSGIPHICVSRAVIDAGDMRSTETNGDRLRVEVVPEEQQTLPQGERLLTVMRA